MISILLFLLVFTLLYRDCHGFFKASQWQFYNCNDGAGTLPPFVRGEATKSQGVKYCCLIQLLIQYDDCHTEIATGFSSPRNDDVGALSLRDFAEVVAIHKPQNHHKKTEKKKKSLIIYLYYFYFITK